jgi:hypothetical protein
MTAISQSEAALALADFQQAINQRFQQFRQTSGSAAGMNPSTGKLSALISVIDMLTATLQMVTGYADRAIRAREAGYPDLAAQLESAARDIETAVQAYADMYQEAQRVLQTSWPAPAHPDQAGLRQATDATAAAQRQFAAAMRP